MEISNRCKPSKLRGLRLSRAKPWSYVVSCGAMRYPSACLLAKLQIKKKHPLGGGFGCSRLFGWSPNKTSKLGTPGGRIGWENHEKWCFSRFQREGGGTENLVKVTQLNQNALFIPHRADSRWTDPWGVLSSSSSSSSSSSTTSTSSSISLTISILSVCIITLSCFSTAARWISLCNQHYHAGKQVAVDFHQLCRYD